MPAGRDVKYKTPYTKGQLGSAAYAAIRATTARTWGQDRAERADLFDKHIATRHDLQFERGGRMGIENF
jgi:hypothetical protein